MRAVLVVLIVVCGLASPMNAQSPNPSSSQPDRAKAVADMLAGRFKWTAGPPLVAPASRPDLACVSVKDPSIVRHQGRWHLFCSIRSTNRPIAIEHLTFADWKDADAAPRTMLPIHDKAFGAPQVFYFTPQKKWYLVYQASNDAWQRKYQCAFSTTEDIADPKSWTPPRPLGLPAADGNKTGLDFWVICDGDFAYAFFTTLDGHMWRSRTKLADFPAGGQAGWSKPALAVAGDIFEAGHVYRLKGLDKFLALIEAQGGHGWRYYKAYLADRLDGPWRELAATREHAFASMANVTHTPPRWTDSISHIELIRAGFDEKLEADPVDLRVVFQGVSEKARSGKAYGAIPWRLGILEPVR